MPTLSYADALLELNDRAGVFEFIAVAQGPGGRPLMSAQGDLRHWTSERLPGTALSPDPSMAGLYRVGGARIDLDADGVQTVERVEVAEPGDGLLFRMKGGGAVRVSWHG